MCVREGEHVCVCVWESACVEWCCGRVLAGELRGPGQLDVCDGPGGTVAPPRAIASAVPMFDEHGEGGCRHLALPASAAGPGWDSPHGRPLQSPMTHRERR